jgi:hypothetical protein
METSESVIIVVLTTCLVAVLCFNFVSNRYMINSIDDLNKEVNYLRNEVMIEKGVNLSEKDGYNTGSYFVVETKDKDMARVEDIMLHEFGHYYYNTVLDKEQRKEWVGIYNHTKDFISNYSKTNELEGFAEVFEAKYAVYENDEELPIDNATSEFFDMYVTGD